MTATNTSRAAFAASVVTLLSSADNASAEFRQIAFDYDATDPVGVVLPSICIGDITVPKTMYTIEPADPGETKVKILTEPQDLVETGYDEVNKQIYFKFIPEIAAVAENAGVLIQFPSDKLESVDVCCSQSVQIKEGFTNFQSMTASTGASVNAIFGVEQDKDLAVGVFSGSEVNLEVTGTSGAKAGSRVITVARDNSKLSVDGDVTTLSCNDGSSCKIAGSISDPADSKARGNATIETSSCEDVLVTTESVCLSQEPNVTVTTDAPLMISGEKEDCVQGESLVVVTGRPVKTGSPTVSPQPTAEPVPTVAPTIAPTKESEPTNENTPTLKPTRATYIPPTRAPTSGAASKQSGVLATVAIGAAALCFLLAQ